MVFWLSLGIFIFGASVQVINYFFWKKNLKVFTKILFLGAIGFVLIYFFYLVYAQYLVWRDSDNFTKFLVPPYKNITYVIGYHFMRFALYYAISLVMALIFLWATKYYNKKFGGKFFEPEEPYLGALSIFLLGNREWNYGWILYLVLLLVFSAVGSAIFCNWLKKMERFPLYWLWLPTAILAIIVMRYLGSNL